MASLLVLRFGGVGQAEYVEVWESREDQARFMEERLGAALQAGGVTDPPSSVEWIELVSYVTTT